VEEGAWEHLVEEGAWELQVVVEEQEFRVVAEVLVCFQKQVGVGVGKVCLHCLLKVLWMGVVEVWE
jgi:hypothetical protein